MAIDIGLRGCHVGDVQSLFGAQEIVEQVRCTKGTTYPPRKPFGRCTIDGSPAEDTVFIEKEVAKLCPANTGRLLQHGVEDRLQIARRTADDLEHLRCRGL